MFSSPIKPQGESASALFVSLRLKNAPLKSAQHANISCLTNHTNQKGLATQAVITQVVKGAFLLSTTMPKRGLPAAAAGKRASGNPSSNESSHSPSKAASAPKLQSNRRRTEQPPAQTGAHDARCAVSKLPASRKRLQKRSNPATIRSIGQYSPGSSMMS